MARPRKSPTQPADPPPAPEPLWTIDEVAAYLGIPKQTIYRWRAAGTGPPSHRIGRHVRYRRDEVERWVRRQP